MENIITMNKIWAYLQSFSLSSNNREWLIGKLQEPAAKPEETEEDIRKRVEETHKMLWQGKTVPKERMQELIDLEYEEPNLEPYTMEELYDRVDEAEKNFAEGKYYYSEDVERYMDAFINSLPD